MADYEPLLSRIFSHLEIQPNGCWVWKTDIVDRYPRLRIDNKKGVSWLTTNLY